MPACWCPARTNRYAPAPAAGFPAPGRRHDQCCRTAKSRMRAGLVPWLELGPESQDRASCSVHPQSWSWSLRRRTRSARCCGTPWLTTSLYMARSCCPMRAWTSRPKRASLWGDVVAGLAIGSWLSGFSATGSKLVLRCFIASSLPRSPVVLTLKTPNLMCANALMGPGVPLRRARRELFLHCEVFANNLSALWKGRVFRVDLASRTPASAVAAPLCPGLNRQPSLWRRLCRRDRGIPDRQSAGAGNELQSAGRSVPPLHQNLEFGRGERQGGSRRRHPAARAASDPNNAAAAASFSAGGLGGFLGRRCRRSARLRPADAARLGRRIRPRACGRNCDLRPHHRG